MTKLEDMLIDHEGLKLKPYKDTVGIWTCGVGHNMQEDDKMDTETPWTMEKVMTTLKNDIKNIQKELEQFDWFKKLDGVRQDVITDMAFNLGLPRFLGFQNLIAALKKKDYKKASAEMIQSKWAQQVKRRAYTLSQMMLTGEYLHDN
jgi:lysozyme